MAGIEGIDIAFNGDTKSLESALAGVTKLTKGVASELKDVDKLLKLDPSNTELVTQKQQLLQQQIKGTAASLDTLRNAQSQVQKQFDSSTIDGEQYRAFRREVLQAETQLGTLKTQLQTISEPADIAPIISEFERLAQQSEQLTGDLKQIDKALKMDPDNVELLEQRMRTLSQQAQMAETHLQSLQSEQQEMEAAFSSGTMGQDEFDQFRRSVIQAEQQVQSLNETIRSVGESHPMADIVKGLTDVANQSKAVTSELKHVETLLKLDPGNTELIAQKQQLLQQQIQGTAASLNTLRNAQSQVQQQFDSGNIDGEEYRAFRREVLRAETQLGTLRTQLQQMTEPVDLTPVLSAFQILEQQSQGLVKELGQVEQALKMDPGNTELLEQRMRVLSQQAQVAGTQLQNLHNEQQQMEASFSSGTMGQGEYDQFRRSVIRAEQQVRALDEAIRTAGDSNNLSEVEKRLNDIRQAAERAGGAVGGLGGALGGLAVGVGVAGAVAKSLDMASLDTSIDIGFNISEGSKDSVNEAIKEVTTYGVEIEDAFEGARRQYALNADASDEANNKALTLAATMTRTYKDLDFTELVQETYEIGKELDITNEEALALANTLLSTGFPPDQIDTIAEYGSQLKRAGFEAEEIQGIMTRAAQTGTWSVDNLLDGLKEGRVKAIEMGNGLTDGFADAIRGVTNNTKAASEETLSAMKKTSAAKEDALQESNDNQRNILQSGLDAQLETAQASHDKQTTAYTKSLDTQLKAAEKSADNQQKSLEKSHDAELKSAEKLAESKIKLIDKEYKERLKLVDEERYNALKKIDDEIAGIEGVMAAEDKLAEDADNNAKRNELTRSVSGARSSKAKVKAEEELAKFEADLLNKAVQAKRKASIDGLKADKDGVKAVFDERVDKIKAEQSAAQERAQASIEADKEAIATRQNMEKDAFAERKELNLTSIREQNAEDLKAYQVLGQQKLDSIRDQNKARLDELAKSHKAEQDQMKAMNEGSIDRAANPVDSSETKAMIKQLEDWGKAVAASDKDSGKALVNMTKWLDSIEDDTLKNLIGVEMFGSKWEDQGENIIETLTGVDGAIVPVAESMEALQENQNAISTDPTKKLAESMNELLEALAPVLDKLAEIVGELADWVSANPELAGGLAIIMGIVGLVSGVLLGLAPIIGAIITVVQIFGGAMALLSGPVVLIIAGIVALIAIFVLLYQNWDTLSAKAEQAFTFVRDFINGAMDSVTEKITAAMDWIDEKTNGAFTSVTDAVRNAMATASEIVGIAMEAWKVAFSTALQIIKDLFSGNFGDAYEGVKTHLDNMRNYVTTIIDAIKEFLTGIDLGEIGADVMKGFVDGILGMKDATMDAIKNVVGDGVVGKAIEILDTHSPSKVFDKLGTFSGEGLVNGLKSMGAKVANASARMTAGTIADPGGVELAGVGAQGGNTTAAPVQQQTPQITIQNMTVRSEDDIRKIARELHRLSAQDKKGR